ncbi:DUF2784 domain-containing protein [Marinilabiliaceae bacterium JC017]|nr:DUF2784 domain-containing protein [Marinilabiliaceae bacterium JC017]
MIFQILADLTIIIHGLFILFILFGALLAFRWKRIIWFHLPLAIWGAMVEYFHWICPLTPLENHFRRLSGEAGYEGDFIEQYLIPVIYPENLTPQFQIIFGSIVVVINLIIYSSLVYKWKKNK